MVNPRHQTPQGQSTFIFPYGDNTGNKRMFTIIVSTSWQRSMPLKSYCVNAMRSQLWTHRKFLTGSWYTLAALRGYVLSTNVAWWALRFAVTGSNALAVGTYWAQTLCNTDEIIHSDDKRVLEGEVLLKPSRDHSG